MESLVTALLCSVSTMIFTVIFAAGMPGILQEEIPTLWAINNLSNAGMISKILYVIFAIAAMLSSSVAFIFTVCNRFEPLIDTALDTAGEPFTRKEPGFSVFQRLIDSTDLVLLDIKRIDPEAHKSLTGHDNQNILDFARFLSERKVPVWIRYVLVPGINDDLATLQRTRAFLNTLSNVEQVDILPYHTMGIYKWEELGYTYTLRNVDPPDEETIRRASETLIEGGGCEFDREACLKQ